VELLAETLTAKGVKVDVYDLARCDMAEAVGAAFRYSKLVLATTTYNMDVFPFMKEFIHHLTERCFSEIFSQKAVEASACIIGCDGDFPHVDSFPYNVAILPHISLFSQDRLIANREYKAYNYDDADIRGHDCKCPHGKI
jgi:hypothetical protein